MCKLFVINEGRVSLMGRRKKSDVKHGNPNPVLGHANNPYLIQNKSKLMQQEHPDKIAKALSNSLMFAGEFKAEDYKKGIVRAVETPEQCAERLNWFFKTCEETQQLPTIEKMYLALGMTREQGARDWIKPNTHYEIKQMLFKAKNIIASMDSELASTGVLQPVVYIFRAKNYYSMTDQINIQATTNNPLEDKQLLEERYKDVDIMDADVVEK